MQIVFLIGLGSFVLSLCHCLFCFKFCNVHLILCMSFSLSNLSWYIFLILSSEFHFCLCALQCLHKLCVSVHCIASVHFAFLYTAVPPYTLCSCTLQCFHTVCFCVHCSTSIQHTASPPCSFLFLSKLLQSD